MKPWHAYTATFAPARADDLKAGANDWIGRRIDVRYVGEVEDGPYAGQQQFDVITEGFPALWVPRCDLADVVALCDPAAL